MFKGIPQWKVNAVFAGLWSILAVINLVLWLVNGRASSLILMIVNLLIVILYSVMALDERPRVKQTAASPAAIRASEPPPRWETQNRYVKHPDDLR